MRLEHLLSGESGRGPDAADRALRGQVNQGTPPFWRECLDKGSKDGYVSFAFLVSSFFFVFGGLAQLARAPALQAGGQRFESVILHHAPLPGLVDHE